MDRSSHIFNNIILSFTKLNRLFFDIMFFLYFIPFLKSQIFQTESISLWKIISNFVKGYQNNINRNQQTLSKRESRHSNIDEELNQTAYLFVFLKYNPWQNHRLRIPTPQIQILEISRKEKERVAFAFNKSTTISLNNSPAPPPSSPPTIPHPLGKLEPRLPVSRGGEGRASARYDGVHRHGFIYLTTLPFKKSQSGRQRGSSGRRAPSASQFRRRERTTKTNPNRVVRRFRATVSALPSFLS